MQASTLAAVDMVIAAISIVIIAIAEMDPNSKATF